MVFSIIDKTVLDFFVDGDIGEPSGCIEKGNAQQNQNDHRDNVFDYLLLHSASDLALRRNCQLSLAVRLIAAAFIHVSLGCEHDSWLLTDHYLLSDLFLLFHSWRLSLLRYLFTYLHSSFGSLSIALALDIFIGLFDRYAFSAD